MGSRQKSLLRYSTILATNDDRTRSPIVRHLALVAPSIIRSTTFVNPRNILAAFRSQICNQNMPQCRVDPVDSDPVDQTLLALQADNTLCGCNRRIAATIACRRQKTPVNTLYSLEIDGLCA